MVISNNTMNTVTGSTNSGIAIQLREQDIRFLSINGNIIDYSLSTTNGISIITESTTTIEALLINNNNIEAPVGVLFNVGASIGVGRIVGNNLIAGTPVSNLPGTVTVTKKIFVVNKHTHTMSNCSYAPNGQIPRDAQFISAVRSKRFVGCTGKFNELEAEEIRVDELIEANNIKFYGAVGDGVTDDTQAFVDGLASVSELFVPSGNYLVSDTISVGASKRLYGDGYTSQILSAQDVIVELSGIRAQIDNLTLEYTGTNFTTSVAIDIPGTDRTTVDSLSILGAVNVAYGIRVRGLGTPDSPTFNTITNNQIHSEVLSILIDGTLSAVTSTVVINNILTAQTATTTMVDVINGSQNTFVGNSLITPATTTNGYVFNAASIDNSIYGGYYSNITNRFVEGTAGNNFFEGRATDVSTRNQVFAREYLVNRVKVVGAQQAAIADAAARGAAYVQAEANDTVDQLNLVIATLRAHGLIAT